MSQSTTKKTSNLVPKSILLRPEEVWRRTLRYPSSYYLLSPACFNCPSAVWFDPCTDGSLHHSSRKVATVSTVQQGSPSMRTTASSIATRPSSACAWQAGSRSFLDSKSKSTTPRSSTASFRWSNRGHGICFNAPICVSERPGCVRCPCVQCTTMPSVEFAHNANALSTRVSSWLSVVQARPPRADLGVDAARSDCDVHRMLRA